MAGGGRMNLKGRSTAEDRRGALFCLARKAEGREKSAKRRFHAAAVRHRSIKQKQANGCLASYRSGDAMAQATRIFVTDIDRKGGVLRASDLPNMKTSAQSI